MRLIKILGLAAVAAIAAMAFVGAGSASAAPHEQIGLCKVEELLLCKEGNIIKSNSGQLLGTAGKGEFVGGLFTESCTSSVAKGTVGAEDSVKLLKGTITSFTFSGCEPCTSVTINGLPLATSLHMKAPLEEPWLLTAPGSATFSGCPLGAKCKFGGSEITALIEMNGTEAIMNTNGTELKLQEGSAFLCGSTGKWFSKYKLRWTLTVGGAQDIVFPTLLGTA